MQFFTVIAAFASVAAAHYGAAPVEESACSAVVTVTVTSYVFSHYSNTISSSNNCNSLLPHNTPSAPASHAVTGPAPYPTVVVPSSPAGTGYPVAPPAGTGAAHPSGTAAPSGTGAYSAPPSQFTGAASSIKVGGALAAGAFAALFL
jgi:hypothetical protein